MLRNKHGSKELLTFFGDGRILKKFSHCKTSHLEESFDSIVSIGLIQSPFEGLSGLSQQIIKKGL